MLAVHQQRSKLYVRSVLLHKAQWEILRTKQPAIYQMFVKNIHLFNEEKGEIALSVLARTVLGSGRQSVISELDERMQDIHLQRDNSTDVRVATTGKRQKLSETTRFQEAGEDSKIATFWEQVLFNQWDRGIFRSPQKGAKKAGVKQHEVSGHLVVVSHEKAIVCWFFFCI